MEPFLKLKLYLRYTELFKIELFYQLTLCKETQYLY